MLTGEFIGPDKMGQLTRKAMLFLRASVVMVTLKHDDGCPCEQHKADFFGCTCEVVRYEIQARLA